MNHVNKCTFKNSQNVARADWTVDRLQTLNARVDALMHKDVVMSIALIYDSMKRMRYYESLMSHSND